jgi:DNA-directed RNA polymerase subunit RPC12/RpoP
MVYKCHRCGRDLTEIERVANLNQAEHYDEMTCGDCAIGLTVRYQYLLWDMLVRDHFVPLKF